MTGGVWVTTLEPMLLGYDYPVLGVFWSMLVFFLWVAWLLALFHVFGDIFRSRDLSGIAKAAWSIFVLVLPFLGVFAYLLVRGGDMARNAAADAQARESAFQSYVKEAAGTTGTADQLAQLAALRNSGDISAAEYEAGKAKVLA
jgi:hypothetical protein